MTAAEVIRRAAAAGLRFELEGNEVVVLGDDDMIATMYETLRPHRFAIRALLEEFTVASGTDAVIAAARLLRHGMWPPTHPSDCTFPCGNPGNDCRRCGGSWDEHCDRAVGRALTKMKKQQARRTSQDR
jgi:hypothetical protein